MKNNKSLIAILCLLCVNLGAMAQSYRSYPASEAQISQNGIFYSIPQTEIVFKVKVEKTTRSKGVYSESAYLLGIDNSSVKSGDSYRIKSVKIYSRGVANPEQQYYLTYDRSTNVKLSDNGILERICSNALASNNSKGKEKPERREHRSVDKTCSDNVTSTRPVFEQSLTEKASLTKHPFLTAQQAVLEIKKLREQQVKILSGEVEGTYLNTTVDYMYKQLDELINGYLCLFTGTEQVSEEEYSFSFIPQKPIIVEEDLLVPVFKFSKENGVSSLNAKNEDLKVVARIHSFNTTKTVATIINEQQNTKDYRNAVSKKGIGIYYSIPEQVEVFAEMADKVLSKKTLGLSQYGTTAVLSSGDKNIRFDTASGAIEAIE